MKHSIWENPVYVKEMRSWRRMRSAHWFRLLYLAVMLFFGLGAFLLPAYEYVPDPDSLRLIFGGACYVELFAALIVATAFAATSITAEREAQTLEDLVVTALTPREIVTGKFLAAAARMRTLLLYSLPPLALAMLLCQALFSARAAGPSLSDLVASQLVVAAAIALCSAIGVLASSLFNRTSYAMGAAITCAVVVTVAVPRLLPALWYMSPYEAEARDLVAAVRGVAEWFAAAVVVASGVFAATILIIRSVRPGLRLDRLWHVGIYGAILIVVAATFHLLPVAGMVGEPTDYYEHPQEPLLTKMLSPTIAMLSIVEETPVPAYVRAMGHSSRWLRLVRPSGLSVWPWMVVTYIPLTAAVVYIAQMRSTRAWRPK